MYEILKEFINHCIKNEEDLYLLSSIFQTIDNVAHSAYSKVMLYQYKGGSNRCIHRFIRRLQSNLRVLQKKKHFIIHDSRRQIIILRECQKHLKFKFSSTKCMILGKSYHLSKSLLIYVTDEDSDGSHEVFLFINVQVLTPGQRMRTV